MSSCSRRRSASSIEITSHSPVEMSIDDGGTRVGVPSGWPVIEIIPENS